VTTGAVGAEFGQAQSGAISFVTKAGGQSYQGALSYETDDLGTLWRNVGSTAWQRRSRPRLGNLTFFVSGTLNGSKSADAALDRDLNRPVYVMSGVDTVVREPVAFGNPLSDTVNIAIRVSCSIRGIATTRLAAARRPRRSRATTLRVPGRAAAVHDNGALLLQSKLQYTYGAGSRISLTGLSSQTQTRNFPGASIYNPDNYTARRSRAVPRSSTGRRT